MHFKKLSVCLMTGAALTAHAQVSDDVVKIGVLNDLSGIYSDLAGQGSVTAARLAIEEMGGKVLGKPVELVFADHQNKPDVAANLARGWFDQGKVDMVTDFPTASTALAVMEIAKQKNRIVMPSSGLATAILGEKCTALTAQWTTNTYALAAGTARALVKDGKKSWYFITADYTFGHSLEKDATEVIKADGGTVVGSSRHPFPGNDFSSFLLKAQASKADVIALANAGNDTVNAIKQANEYGITRKQVVAPLLTYISDVHSIGLEKAQGMYLSEAFYWDFDDRSRAWSKKFFDKQKRMPTAAQAGVYSATLNYLKAVQAAGTDEAKAVMAQLRKMTIDDAVIRNGKLREDGALVHDMLLLQVKSPAESKAPWDYYKVKSVLKGVDVYPPLNPACQIAQNGQNGK
jgi:branched-chain amino acid transport system substrate-binding protein